MPTIVKENYLKALYFLNEQDSRINLTELSKSLDVSKPTASNMIKSLKEHGWVDYKRYKPITLTDKGKKAAAAVIRKHRLTEMFLDKIMGFGWEEVHEIAEQIEHTDSEAFFNRMDEMLDHPTIDPHGSPIPDVDGNIVDQDFHVLADLQVGQKGELAALQHSSSDLLHLLNEKGIQLRITVELINKEPFDGSCVISYDGQSPFTISKKVAQSLLLKII